MGLAALLERHHEEIRNRWQAEARRKLGEIASHAATQALVDAILATLRAPEGAVAEPETTDTAELEPTDVVRSCGILHDVVLTVAAERAQALTPQEVRRIGRATTAATVHAIAESVRERVAVVERRSLDDLLRVAHDLRDQLMVVEGAVAGGRLELVAARLGDLRDRVEHDLELTRLRRVGRMQHRSVALSEILSAAIAQTRETNVEASVFVDMLAPIFVDGDTALLAWSLGKLVHIACERSARPVLNVTARVVCDGLVRIELNGEGAPAGALGDHAADLRLVDEAVRAHHGTLRIGDGDFTIELPGRGEEDACCLGESGRDSGSDSDSDGAAHTASTPAPEIAPRGPRNAADAPRADAPRIELRERAHAVAREVQRMIANGTLQEAPPGLQREVLGAVASLATLDGLTGDSLRRAEVALLRLHLRLELLGPPSPTAQDAPN